MMKVTPGAGQASMPDSTKGAGPMSVHVPETIQSSKSANPAPDSRRCHGPEDCLVLTELPPDAVIDDLDRDGEPLNLVTFGNLRELCPKCNRHHLKLVLRQERVRVAHLFCAECESCFDAHYANGAPALAP
jgi:hypothetical protein